MKKLVSLFLLLIVLAVSGCVGGSIDGTVYLVPASEWTRIPEAPEYTVEAPIPLRVGIILVNSGLDVINEWEEMRLFDSLV